MGLDAHVRCRCIQDGLAKPHPFPDRLAFDETIDPYLTGHPTLDDWQVHDRWFAESCEHSGYLASERLGNIAMIAYVRDVIQKLDGNVGLRFPILTEKVAYNGIHTGDHISSIEAVLLLKEVETVQSNASLDDSGKEFFASMKRLCEASMGTKNPIVF